MQQTPRAVGHRVEQTVHFGIDVPAGSFADQRAAMLGQHLESLARVLAADLDLADGSISEIRIFLADMLPPAPQVDANGPDGWIVPERGEVWCVYRPDAPGVDLDRLVVRLLVLRALGVDLLNLPLLWSGLLGRCGRTLGQVPAPQAINQALLAQSQGHLPALSDLQRPAGEAESPLQELAALAFVDFLAARGGPAQLRAFVSAAAGDSPDRAARAVYGASLRDLERAWHKAVRRADGSAGGVGRFLRGSFRYLRPYWKQELVIFLLLGVQLAFQQILPRAQALLIDDAILPRNLHYLLGLVIALFVLVVLVLLAGVANDLLTSRVSESVLRSLRERMFGQLQRLSHRFYAATESGDILSRFSSDLRAVEQGLTSTLTQGAFLALSLVISAVHILLINWILGVLVLATLPFFLVSTRILGPRANRASLAYSQQQAAVVGVLQEDLAAQPVIKAYNLQPTMIERFRVQIDALYHAAVRLFFLSSLFGVTANLLTTIVQVGALTLGGYFVIEGRLPLGNLIEFLALLGLVIGPVQSITGIIQSIQVATASMDRVEEILSQEPDVRDVDGAAEMGPLTGGVRFENVSFSYQGDQPQLDDVSIEIQAGQSVAFVGPSGSGKSTIVNLLLRFYDPGRGALRFDGRDAREVTLASLHRQVGIVFQESFLFNRSVRDNLRFGREDATDGEVEEAARLAEIHETILQMPQGYDTVVGERGGSLSGGQRQRLAIARAILRSPSILILDEATSALDPRTENAINHTLAALGRGRTTIAVTHRLSAATTADRIFVLDRGRLVQQGTHAELVEQDGLYRRLYEEQGGVIAGAGGQIALEVVYLRSVPIFRSIDGAVLGQIAATLRREEFQPGDEIVRAGDEGDRLYLIVSGAVDVLAAGVGTGERRLAELGSGDYFGEIALLRDAPRNATVRARTAVQLLSLSRDTLRGLVEGIPGLRSALEATAAAREAEVQALESESATAAGQEATPAAMLTGVTRVMPIFRPARLAAVEGPEADRSWPLNDGETGIGRNPGNDIVLTDRRVSGFHARVRRLPSGHYLLVDSNSRNGTAINGHRVVGSLELDDGDTISVGGFTLRFHQLAVQSVVT